MDSREWSKAADWVFLGVLAACALILLIVLAGVGIGEISLSGCTRVDAAVLEWLPMPVRRYVSGG